MPKREKHANSTHTITATPDPGFESKIFFQWLKSTNQCANNASIFLLGTLKILQPVLDMEKILNFAFAIPTIVEDAVMKNVRNTGVKDVVQSLKFDLGQWVHFDLGPGLSLYVSGDGE